MAATSRRVGDGRVSNDTQRNDLDDGTHIYDGLHLHGIFGEGARPVISYRDFLALKGIKPIVIERTIKQKGDKIIVSSYKPAEIAR